MDGGFKSFGSIVSLPVAAYKGSLATVGHGLILGESTGAYVGAGAPLP